MNGQTPSRLPLHSTESSKLCPLLAFHGLVKKKTKEQNQNRTQRNWQAQACSDEEIKHGAPGHGSEFSEKSLFPRPVDWGLPSRLEGFIYHQLSTSVTMRAQGWSWPGAVNLFCCTSGGSDKERHESGAAIIHSGHTRNWALESNLCDVRSHTSGQHFINRHINNSLQRYLCLLAP